MNILIRVDSSHLIGTGHVFRCLHLAYFLKKFNYQISFICRDLPDNIISTIINNNFNCIVLKFTNHKKYLEKSNHNDYLQWLGVDWESDAKETISVIKDSVHLLIIDHYSIDYKWEQLLKKYVNKLMVIDDLANRQHSCDILLDHNYYINMYDRYNHLVPKYCKLFLGPSNAIINPILLEIKKKKELLFTSNKFASKNIVIFFGGIDKDNYTQYAINNILNNKNYKNYIIHVVVGEKYKYLSTLKKSVINNINILIHINPPYYYYLLLYANLAIGAAGVSQLERMYINLPSIVFPIADNQKKIYNDLLEKNLIFNNFNVDINKLDYIKVKYFNIDNIINILNESITMYIRKANINDSKMIYNWRTHNNILKVSENKEIFSYQDHYRWFVNQLKSNKSMIIIGEINNIPIGLVRFDNDLNNNDIYYISIFLNPNETGKGYGFILLNKSIHFIQKYHKKIEIIANIMHNNIPSIKLFEKLGFKKKKNVYSKKLIN